MSALEGNQKQTVQIVALTETGLKLAKRLQTDIAGSTVCYKPKPFAETIQTAFLNGSPLVFICATGIVVRTLASVIKNKHDDPPVLVLDEQGQFVIPLLSGHEGGANQWAVDIAALLAATAVLTTANSYVEPVYTVGMGCERNCSKQELAELFHHCLEQAGLNADAITNLTSIDIKADEQGLIQLAQDINKAFVVYDKIALKNVEHQLSCPSDYVYETVGVYGVAESAALWGAQEIAGQQAELVLVKQKSKRATCAIARAYCSKIPIKK